MYGLTVAELSGTIPSEPLLDRLERDGIRPLLATTSDASPDLRDYVDMAAVSGFPEPALRLPAEERAPWWESYLDQLVTRDLAEIGAHRDPALLRRYLEAYAISSATTTDHRTIIEAAGVAKATGGAYERLLTNLLVADALPAWWSNRLKRLVRGPKRYLVDPAMVLALMRANVAAVMRDGGLLGQILDTFVVAELRAQLSICASQPRLFHLRQENGQHEVDVIVEYGGGRVFGLEIRATSSPDVSDARHLGWLRDGLGDRFVGGAVLCSVPRSFVLADQVVAAPIAAIWS
jgi:predicted AAA+ superfamily ATPase